MGTNIDFSKIKRIILSRKGFDSTFGELPNAIINNKDFVVFPIPSITEQHQEDDTKYSELYYYYYNNVKKSLADIMIDLKPNVFNWKLMKKSKGFCHFDPDIVENEKERKNYKWVGAFGQSDQAFSHLKNQKVDEYDLFLFFGRFREVDMDENGKCSYKKNAKDKQVIYGYLLIDHCVDNYDEMQKNLNWHPHSVESRKEQTDLGKNGIYIAEKIDNEYCCGHFKYDKCLDLTKEGSDKITHCRNDYKWFNKLTYHSENSKKEDYFQAVSRGQEFVAVIEENDGIRDFLKTIFKFFE